MDNGKDQSQDLLNHRVSFAEELLSKYGEFYPFGGAIDETGQIISVAAYDGTEMPPSDALIKMLESGLREGARSGKYIASALIYDARVVPPGGSEKSDAIIAELEHRDGFAMTVYFPYRLENGQPEFSASFGTADKRDIFG